MNNDKKIVVGLFLILILGAIFVGYQQYQKKENVEAPLVQNYQSEVQEKVYINKEDRYKITLPNEITVGTKSQNSVLGTTQNPMGGTYVGNLVFIVLSTNELKKSAQEQIDHAVSFQSIDEVVDIVYDPNVPISANEGAYCSKVDIKSIVPILFYECGGEGGYAIYAIIKGPKYDVFIDGYSQGFPTKNLNNITFKSKQDLIKALSTFEFLK